MTSTKVWVCSVRNSNCSVLFFNYKGSEAGLQLQAMDNSHVSLVSLSLRAEGFENYRCDRNMSMGMNLASLAKIMKCSNNDDVVTIKAQDSADVVTFVFESKNGDRVSDFDMKLMNLDQEHLGIPVRFLLMLCFFMIMVIIYNRIVKCSVWMKIN